jgi:hypothetical protein
LFFFKKKRTPSECWTPQRDRNPIPYQLNQFFAATMPSNTIINYEERVDLAAERYQNETGHTYRQLAKEFDVKHDVIWRRINGILGKTAQIPTNRALNDVQEDTLLYWIHWLDNHQAGFRLRR